MEDFRDENKHYTLLFTNQAADDFANIQEIYDKYSLQAGDNFISAFEVIKELLEDWPYAAKIYDESTGVRCRQISKRYPFALFYRVHADELQVVALALQSSRQNPASIKEMIANRIKELDKEGSQK